MFEQVVASRTMDKVSAERYDKHKQAPDVFPSASSSRTATEPRIPYGVRRRHLLPALVSSSAPQRPRAPARLPVGIIFYLASITLVATATIGVFFGVGFFLLMGSAEGMIPNGSHNSDLSQPVFAAVSRFFGSPSANNDNLTLAPVEAGTPAGSAAVAALPPAPSQPSIQDRQVTPDQSEVVPPPPPSIVDVSAGISQDAPSTGDRRGSEADEAMAAPPALTEGTAEPTLSAPAAEGTPAPPRLILSAAESEELLTRGDTFLRGGDVTSARLFYERVANAGIGQGAMRMGATFDSSFLLRIGLRSARGDPVKAQSWYRRAVELSGTEIEHQPNALK